MKLIVGLGNPGIEYECTRHNVGFMLLDLYMKKNNLSFNKKKFNGSYLDTIINNQKVMFLKPLSYMNLSGEVIEKYIDFYKISIDDVLIISDDLDQEIGLFKLKPMGSSGGHNGLKNIELHLGTNKYKRLKIGISNNKKIDTKDYVLSKFSNSELESLNNVFSIGISIIDDFIINDFDKVMNKYNSMR